MSTVLNGLENFWTHKISGKSYPTEQNGPPRKPGLSIVHPWFAKSSFAPGTPLANHLNFGGGCKHFSKKRKTSQIAGATISSRARARPTSVPHTSISRDYQLPCRLVLSTPVSIYLPRLDSLSLFRLSLSVSPSLSFLLSPPCLDSLSFSHLRFDIIIVTPF